MGLTGNNITISLAYIRKYSFVSYFCDDIYESTYAIAIADFGPLHRFKGMDK